MVKWIVGIVILAGGGYVAYDAFRAGFHTRPAMPEGAFSISFKNGLRGILVNVPDDKKTRRYLGFPMDVPFYLKETWSYCHPPTEEEGVQVAHFMKDRNWPGGRFEAVCKITVEDEVVVRGVIVSVPKM